MEYILSLRSLPTAGLSPESTSHGIPGIGGQTYRGDAEARDFESCYFLRFSTALTAFMMNGAVRPYFSINWSGVADSA